MLHAQRMAEYRRRRHREARRRRGIPRGCPAGPPGPSPLEGSLGDVVDTLRRRLAAYPGVQGLLYCPLPGGARLHVVAQPPMTRPIRALAETWVSKFLDLHPGLELRVQVFRTPPPDSGSYRCAYWRGAGEAAQGNRT